MKQIVRRIVQQMLLLPAAAWCRLAATGVYRPPDCPSIDDRTKLHFLSSGPSAHLLTLSNRGPNYPTINRTTCNDSDGDVSPLCTLGCSGPSPIMTLFSKLTPPPFWHAGPLTPLLFSRFLYIKSQYLLLASRSPQCPVGE